MAVAERPQSFQKARLRRHAAHVAGHRLQNDGGHFARVGLHQLFDVLQVVEAGQ